MDILAVEKIMEFQQSPLYAKYIEALHWDVLHVDNVQMFYKKIPFMGGLLKIQRPYILPPVSKLKKLITTYSVKTLAIEPIPLQNVRLYKKWVVAVSAYCRIVRSEYMLTKTILVDLTPAEKDIFNKFSEAKRRAVRKAQKNGVAVTESQDITELIRIKNKSGGIFGFITTHGIDKFWGIMAPRHATILLAHHNADLIGGILLVFWNTTAFYWVAGASKVGKKLSAPTILVWEALRTARKRGAKKFDFLGVWDERRPNEHHDWKGFTRFKEGFGGTQLYYPLL